MQAIKNFFVELYYSKGHKIGLHMLVNIGIAAICAILLTIFTGTKLTIYGAFQWLITLPIFAVIIMVIRLVQKLIPLPPGTDKVIVDFIIIAIIVTGAGFLMDKIPMPESNILQILIIIAFDIVYVGFMIFLLLSSKNEYDVE